MPEDTLILSGPNYTEILAKKGPFRCVVLDHVIERLSVEESSRLLSRVYDRLAPGGELLVRCTDFQAVSGYYLAGNLSAEDARTLASGDLESPCHGIVDFLDVGRRVLDAGFVRVCPMVPADTKLPDIESWSFCFRAVRPDVIPVVSIIMPVLDQYDFTERAVRSIEKFAGDTPYEIILVDSGSRRETWDRYASLGHTVIGYRTRFRFLRSLNLGVKYAKSDAYIFANNDIVLGSRDFLAPLVKVLDGRADVGVLNPQEVKGDVQVLDAVPEIEPAGFHLYGAFFAMNSTAYEAIGGFCEDYSGYGGEEADISVRLCRAGYSNWTMPSVQVCHSGSATFRETKTGDTDAVIQNVRTFERIWGYGLNFDPYAVPDLWSLWWGYLAYVFYFEEQRRDARLEFAKGPVPRVGIAVITRDRLSMLRQCLDGLDRTTEGYPGEIVRVVCDDGSADGTADYLAAREGWKAESTIEPQGIARTKNRALRSLLDAGCDVMFLVEDDLLPKRDGWLYPWLVLMRAPGYGHVNLSPPDWVKGSVKKDERVSGVDVQLVDKLSGILMAFTREAVEKVGAFDPEFRMYGYEHTDWTHRAARAGVAPECWYPTVKVMDQYFEMMPSESVLPADVIGAVLPGNMNRLKQNEESGVVYVPFEEEAG